MPPIMGGALMDAFIGIAIESAGADYVTGGALSTDFPVISGARQTSYHGSVIVGAIGQSYGGDAFAAKINSGGTGFSYSTYLGGASDESGLGIAFDSTGSTFLT